MGARVVGLWWELREEDARDDECHHVGQVADDQGPTATESVDEHHAEELGDQGNHGID